MKKVLYTLFVVGTMAVAIINVLAFVAGWMSPEDQPWLPFLALGILPLMVVNISLLLFWGAYKSWWSLLPLMMLLLHGDFISSMFQVQLSTVDVPEGKQKIKVISYNVDSFRSGKQDQLFKITSWLKEQQADVVCLQETSAKWLIPADSLAKVFSFYPYQCFSEKAGALLNMTVLSKYPIVEQASIQYPDSQNQSYLCVLDVRGKQVHVFNNHLQTTSVNRVKPLLYKAIAEENREDEIASFKEMVLRMRTNFQMRAKQVEHVRSLIDQAETPVIVCGDFNDPPSTFTYRTMKGNLVDGFQACGSGFGYTFRELRRLFRIDYILYSSDFVGVRYDSPTIDFSDHKPVVWEGYLR